MTSEGRIIRIAGPVVAAVGLDAARLHDVALVGEQALVGEVIRLAGEIATIQVYEDTTGVKIGEPVHSTGAALSVQLGPGLLGQVYDGLQRPLYHLAELTGDFVPRGVRVSPLPVDRQWPFTPLVRAGDSVMPGAVIGTVPETETLEHRILVPDGYCGRVIQISEGNYTIDDPVARIATDSGEKSLHLAHHWPVRRARPIGRKLVPDGLIVTGTRIIDAFFPMARGGTAIIPGGFGTGKTVVQQSLARWSDVDVVVYVGCGERGNEMTEVLDEFPQLQDPRHGVPLMQRTVLIANTSDMPVAAREASIYTGMTIAEYYRDMGYNVLMLADSTSRWGEALREISSRLEEMPGEEGYPAYLGSRLAELYERAGHVEMPGDRRQGSVTVVGAVSPPGGDFSEPITQGSMRVAGTFWALDYDLSRRRHFPAINWITSYSLYNIVHEFADDWPDMVQEAIALLQREADLQEIVQLVGPDALTEEDQLDLFVSRMLREDFLQQSALDPVDQYSLLSKTYWMLKVIMSFYERAQDVVNDSRALKTVEDLPVVTEIARMKRIPSVEAESTLMALVEQVRQAFEEMVV